MQDKCYDEIRRLTGSSHGFKFRGMLENLYVSVWKIYISFFVSLPKDNNKLKEHQIDDQSYQNNSIFLFLVVCYLNNETQSITTIPWGPCFEIV